MSLVDILSKLITDFSVVGVYKKLKPDIKNNIQESISLGWRTQIIDELNNIYSEHSKTGWDGYNADPISDAALEAAKLFTELLPDNIIKPELTPESTGNISFDWRVKDDSILSISVTQNKIIYAQIRGLKKIHGEVPFIHKIPEDIHNRLIKYYSK